jgi:hypothetical protein
VRFLRFYVLRLGLLDGVAGFAHIAIGAFATFLKYAKLRALAQAGRGVAPAGEAARATPGSDAANPPAPPRRNGATP